MQKLERYQLETKNPVVKIEFRVWQKAENGSGGCVFLKEFWRISVKNCQNLQVGQKIRISSKQGTQSDRGLLQKIPLTVQSFSVFPERLPSVIAFSFKGLAFLYKKFDQLSQSFLEKFPSTEGSLIIGLLFGQAPLPKPFKDSLARLGMQHITSVSGYNLSLVMNIAIRLLQPLQRKRLRLGVLLVILLLYLAICGFGLPLLRAALMFVLMQLGELFFRRQYSGVYALFLSATFFLIWDSWLIFSLSFQLTVAATLGVMLAADKVSWVFGQVMGFFSRFIGLPRLKVFLIPWKIFRESLVTTLSAQAFVWPILFAAFGQTSLLAFFANPLLLWIIPPATFWGILYAVFFFIVPGSENIVVLPLWGFLSLLVRGVQAWSILPTEFGQLHAQLSWGWVGVWWTVLWFLLNWRPKYTQSLN